MVMQQIIRRVKEEVLLNLRQLSPHVMRITLMKEKVGVQWGNMFVKLLVPIVAFLGIIDAAYITYEKLSGIVPPCAPGFHCAAVLESKWASIGPIPLSLLGALYYTFVLILSSLYFLEIRHISIAGKKISTFGLLRIGTLFGFFFSLYLVFLMGVIIQAWCFYCLLSALACTTLFVLVNLLAIVRKRSKEDQKEYPIRLAFFALAYQYILKPFFFLLDPELVHNQMVKAGEILGKFPLTRFLTRISFAVESPVLTKTVAGITFPNPVGLSAGFDYDAHLYDILPDVGFGFATIGTVTRYPYEGNTRPMLSRFPDSKALLVNKGFKSLGAQAIIDKLEGKKFRIPIGISIGSTNREYSSVDDQIDDIIQSFTLFEKSPVAHSYYELNISCPNTKGGQPFTDVKRFQKLVGAFERLQITKPVFLKMPIDLQDGLSSKETLARLLDILKIAAKAKSITGVICGNLTKDHENPSLTKMDRESWKSKKGGVSGKPTFDRSNALISLTKKEFGNRFIIIGTGGIFSGEDAKEKMRLGADLVQLITGMIFQGPQVIGEINWEIAHSVRSTISHKPSKQ